MLTDLSKQKIKFTDYVKFCIFNKSYPISFFSILQNKIVDTTIVFDNVYKNFINYYDTNLMKQTDINNIYIVLGSLILCNLSTNNNLYNKYIKPFKKNVLITHIFPNNSYSNNDVFYINDVINKINDIKINTIDDVVVAIQRPYLKNMLKITTVSKKVEIIPYNIILEETKKILVQEKITDNFGVVDLIQKHL
jgi:hypothetical protein